jgi:CMP-N-acetylneuraminic acid synthetase
MSVLGVTLARGGSKGIPRKNIRPLCGKPLLQYTFDEVYKCNLLDDYVLSSDDDEIIKLAQINGVDWIRRPPQLAQDDTPHLPALLHALLMAETKYDKDYDLVADIRCTNPLKNAFDIDSAIEILTDNPHADCVVGVSQAVSPGRLKILDAGLLADVWSEPESGRRQDCIEGYVRNGSIYVVKAEILKSGKFFIGTRVVPWVMPRMRSINIDDWVDFWTAAAILENLNG